jgi:hypothetical protein
MIEEIVREHLKTILDVPVLMEEENKEKKYILLEKTGGSEVDHIKHATLAVQSFSDKIKRRNEGSDEANHGKRWRLQVRTKQ